MAITLTQVGSAAGAALFLCGLSGCGFGTAGVAALANDGGVSNAPPVLGVLDVRGSSTDGPKVSPARIRLVLADAEANPASVDLAMVVPGQAEQRLLAVASNPMVLATSRDGVTHDVAWDFASEPGLPAAGGFVPGVRVIARVQGGGSREAVVGLGNDAPVIVSVQPSAAEVAGVAPIRFTLQDTADDLVDVKVEFQIDGDTDWQLARPASLLASEATPEFAFVGLPAPRGGAAPLFFWDTNHATQLLDLERTIRLRFTARDSVATGAGTESTAFRVDNNQVPIFQFDNLSFAANPDQSRGLPLRYTLIDDERDLVRVLLQWRLESEPGFPALPSDVGAMEAILRDPRLAREKHICTPFPSYARGYAQPVDPRRVRLPELRQGQSRLLARGIQGLHVELMRPSVPMSLPATWRSDPLRGPVGVVPIGLGTNAIVLDTDAAGSSSRLLEVELTTGRLVRTIAAGISGAPSAVALERWEDGALVATDMGGTWMLHRVDLRTGAVFLAGSEAAGGAAPGGPIRAVVSLATGVALITAEDGGSGGLYQLDWNTPTAVRITRSVGGLRQPWGLAVDPLHRSRVLVAEHDAGRVVMVDLDTRVISEVSATGVDGEAPFPRVTALAVARRGEHLVALCQPWNSKTAEIRGLNRGTAGGGAYPLGKVKPAASVATGPADLVVLAHPEPADLTAHGGVEQVREVVAYAIDEAVATVATDFDPAPRINQAWRIQEGRTFEDPARGSPTGTNCVMLWDSREVHDSGRVFLQARCFDSEEGSVVRAASPRLLQGPFVDAVSVPTAPLPTAAVPADLDGDGDVDLVCANPPTNTLTVFLKGEASAYSPAEFVAQPSLPAGSFPVAVVVADLDRDGDPEIVCANSNSNDLTVFRQDAAHAFAVQATLPAGDGPRSVVAADLDGDDDLDLACANAGGNSLTLYFQGAGGSFAAQPPLSVGSAPFAVAAADLDGDGDVDLTVANRNSNDLTIFAQGPPGAFSARSVAMPPARHPSAIVAADLDGDGDADLACANSNTDDLTVLFQEASLEFSTTLSLRALDDPEAIVAADLDGDGDLDLACSNFFREELSVFYQEARRSFAAQPPVRVGNAPASLAAADVDGDGDVDLVCANHGSSNLTVLLQDAPLKFAASGMTLPIAPSVAADMDGDGDLDLVGLNGNSLSVLYQDAPRSVAGQPMVADASTTLTAVVAADLDGDGDLDVACGTATGALTVFLQVEPRQFNLHPTLLSPVQSPNSTASVVAADVDGDGDLDLVQAARYLLPGQTSHFVIYFQAGAGDFSSLSPLVVPMSVGSSGVLAGFAAVADMDGDGDADLLGGPNQYGSPLSLYRQEGPLVFVAQPPLSGGSGSAKGVVAEDLDLDGDLDLACATASISNDAEMLTIYQDAQHRFEVSPLGSSSYFRGAIAVSAADLDGDGDLDLVFGGQFGAEVWIQDRPHSYAEQTRLSEPVTIIADVDGDGDPDLVSWSTVSWGRR